MRFVLALLLGATPVSAQVRVAPSFGQTGSVSVVPSLSLPAPLIPSSSLNLNSSSSLSPSMSVAFAPTISPAISASPLSASVSKALSPLSAQSSAAPSAETPKAQPPVEAAAAEAAATFDGAPMNILIAGGESVPFIKTGGLADVVDAVSAGLAARGHSVTIVLPKYSALKTAGLEFEEGGSVSVPVDGRVETAKLLVARRNGVRVALLDHPGYYERPGNPYSSYSGYDAQGHDDADERFGFFARAALEAMKAFGEKPDIVHAHDWHAALMPAFLKETLKDDPFFAGTKSVVTIHNIAYQGVFGARSALKFGLNPNGAGGDAKGETYGFLRAGLAAADAVTTVSPTYAREIVEDPLFGMGLEELLSARPDGVHGIVNGVDPEVWSPETDPTLARNYGVEDAAEGKAVNKAAMQARLGLETKPDAPLFVVASRLAEQKGIDLVVESARGILALGGQLAIMGSGDKVLEDAVAALVKEFPGQIASHGFDEVAVRMLFAAADFLLMPSRFEPCGLSQLIAQRYGTLPIVTRTGGLVDTVQDLRDDPVNGDGLVVRALASISLLRAVADAVKGYGHSRALSYARRAAMTKDSSWDASLAIYESLFRRLLGREK